MQAPLVFISYSHDSLAHRTWVLQLATDLSGRGIPVMLDQWTELGQNLTRFMSGGISDSDYVLLICTERYVERSEALSGGAAFEGMIVGAEILREADTRKFIPIFRGNRELRAPALLGARRGVDFNDDDSYPKKLDELVHGLLRTPSRSKPAIGAVPSLADIPRHSYATGVAPAGWDSGVLDGGWYERQHAEAWEIWREQRPPGGMEVRIAVRPPVAHSQRELLAAVERSQIDTFGWPIAVVLRPDECRPRPVEDGIRARIAAPDILGPGGATDSADYWAVRKSGEFYLQQTLFEDQRSTGKLFFNTRIVRIAEVFMFAARLYSELRLSAEDEVAVRITHFGLEGRQLASSNPARLVKPHRCAIGRSSAEVFATLQSLDRDVVDHVEAVAAEMFRLFDFCEFERSIYESIVGQFRQGRVT